MGDASRNDADRLRELAERHLWMPYSPPGAQGSVRDQIRVMTHGRGVRTWDAEGREYLDGTSALEALILGHGDEEVVEAIATQARTMSFVDVFRFVTPPQVELAAELVAASPGMAMAHFTPGGAEADEVALKMARQYHALRGEPYRMKVITREGAFHGVTAGAMALDGHYFASRNVVYDGGVKWGRTVPAGACERCDFGKAGRHLPRSRSTAWWPSSTTPSPTWRPALPSPVGRHRRCVVNRLTSVAVSDYRAMNAAEGRDMKGSKGGRT